MAKEDGEKRQEFARYLREQMRKRDMIAADLSRLTGYASSVISS